MVDLGNGFEANVLKTFEGGDYRSSTGFGLELDAELTGPDVDNFLLSPEDGSFWELMREYEILFAKINPLAFDFKHRIKATLPKTDWFSATNDRRIMNVLWHGDPHDMAIYSSEDRGPTAYAPREYVVQAYLNNLDAFKLKYPHLEDCIVRLQIELEVCYQTKTLYFERNRFDPVKRLISQFIIKISRDQSVEDEDVFALQKSLDEGIGDKQIVRPWKTGDLAIRSRRNFHQRVCATVDNISDTDSPFYFYEAGPGVSSYAGEFR